jgi:hypothetical protein
MKLVAAIILCLVSCGISAGECTPERNGFLSSYDRVRITVALNGVPERNVTLDIIELGGVPHLSVPTKEDGVAVLPLLPPGKYWIIARSQTGRGAELCLAVEISERGETSSFSMPLVANQRIATERTQLFRGTLVDANDARIAGAKIVLFRMGSLQAAPVLEASSAEDGVFTGPLPDGQYLAIFTKFGFRPALLILEIAKKEKTTNLRIAMQTESMPASMRSEARL